MADVTWEGGPSKQQQKDLDTKGYYTLTGVEKERAFKITCGCGGIIRIANIGIYRYSPTVWGGTGECGECKTSFGVEAPSMEELPDVLFRVMNK
jgi:hypothetical protein